MNALSTRAAGVVLAAATAVAITACDPTDTTAEPTTAAPAVTTVETVTATPAPAAATPEQQDRTFFDCAAPLYGLNLPYEVAKAIAPESLDQMTTSGREMAAVYIQVADRYTPDEAAVVAGITDPNAGEIIVCAVDAFGGAAS